MRTPQDSKPVRVAIYARVSTSDQNCQMQLGELRDYARVRGWTLVEEFSDQGWSGSKVGRPAFRKLMRQARLRRFDIVLCWKLDRFGRSLIDCLAAIQELKSAGVRLISVTQGIDTDESNPAARFQLQVLGAAAEFERELIRERSRSGLIRYRQDYAAGRIGRERSSRSGKNLPIGRPKRIFDRQQVTKLRSEGHSLRQIATTLGIGLGTVSRVLDAVPKTDPESNDSTD